MWEWIRRRRRLRRAAAGLVAGFAALVAVPTAGATWSIVAADRASGSVGVAIASCVDIGDLATSGRPLPPVALAPAAGAGVAQGLLDPDAPIQIVEGLEDGRAPGAIVAALAESEADPRSAERQQAVVALDGTSAGHDGARLGAAAVSRRAAGVAAQGNRLVSRGVVEDSLAAYQRADADGADLPMALAAALQAGADRGGDRRCGDRTALFAHIAVADADGGTLVLTSAPGGEENPVESLSRDVRAAYAGDTEQKVPSWVIGAAAVALALVLAAGLLVGRRRARA